MYDVKKIREKAAEAFTAAETSAAFSLILYEDSFRFLQFLL